jgi:uncharacterized protein (DUF2384 family)
MNKDIADVIKRLEKQIAAIEHAISVLQAIDDEEIKQPVIAKRGRPKKAGPKRILSPEAKERIAAAQRKRWAAARKAAKKTAVRKAPKP